MKKYKIVLEDLGQDLLEIYTDEQGVVQRTEPFHTEIYRGAYVPVNQSVGQKCAIHHPPHIEFGFLKYIIEGIVSL